MNLQPLIIVQARMNSTRLRGKVLLPICGEPILAFLVKRLSSLRIPLVIATTTLQSDNAIQDLGIQMSVPVFRGSEDDVLDRYVQVSRLFPCDVVIRITADCPLLDPALVQAMMNMFRAHTVDYVSNTIRRTFPRGYDVEVVSREALEMAWNLSKDLSEREHVTLYIVEHEELFSRMQFIDAVDRSSWRLTVDTKEDYALVTKVADACRGNFSYNDVADILVEHPEWKMINGDIQQKNVR
jgi:spore coat polysaccharide biosynthesis protein SpsF